MSLHRSLRRLACSFAVALLMTACFALPGQASLVWSESGDAGSLPADAQVVSGSGLLTEISGELIHDFGGAGQDFDMYRIHVYNPAAFQAALFADGAVPPETQLYLFDALGRPIVADNYSDAYPDNPINMIPAGTLTGYSAGFYYLAVAESFIEPGFSGDLPYGASGPLFDPQAMFDDYDLEPLSPDENLIWASSTDPVTHWQLDGDESLLGGVYRIELQGAGDPSSVVPEPAGMVAWSLLCLLGLAALRRRARGAAASA